MPNDYFRFKQFLVRQDACAMKVGTDGTLLGAWAKGGERILDVGTGTGLVALMMAQRYPQSTIVGIDIDEPAVLQARQNVSASPFVHRVNIEKCDVRVFTGLFDAIISNPPYFESSLQSTNQQRMMARHTSSLSYSDLMASAYRLLDEKGEFSIVIPFDYKTRIESEAALAGFFLSRDCAVKTTPTKTPRRYLLAFRKKAPELVERSEGILETAPNQRSAWYEALTRDFYLDKKEI